MKLPTYVCKRCGYTWVPRTKDPLTCPSCRNRYWNKERRNNRGDKSATTMPATDSMVDLGGIESPLTPLSEE